MSLLLPPKKKGKRRRGCVGRGDEARRHSCKRDRRWETQSRWHGALLGGPPRDHVPCLGTFWCAAVTDVKVSPSVRSICSLSHMCDWQGYAHAISWYIWISSLTCMCVTHTFSHTHRCTHFFLKKSMRGCTHTRKLMTYECDNSSGVWRNSQENLSSHRRNSKRGWGAGAPVGAVIALCD